LELTGKTFEDLHLIKAVQKAVSSEQYRTPTPIQIEAIPHVLNGRDVLGVAQTGTGKTAAFALPILHQLGKNRKPQLPKVARVLVLSPTRELAAQTAVRFESYGQNMNIRLATVYGGVGQGAQVKILRKGVHILIATPGRLIDLIDQGHVELNRLSVFVVDEADRMLDMGFLPDLKRIVSELPDKRQSLFFSATMPAEARELADKMLYKPARIDVTPYNPGASTIETITQRVMFIEDSKRKALLTHLLKNRKTERVLVFVRTKHSARKLAKRLVEREFTADSIHGDRPQRVRNKTMQAFRKGTIKVLVATDVAARGIDVEGVSHVINFDMPSDPELYVHRIGRTGRAGAEGNAITFCIDEDLEMLRTIEADIQLEIECDPNHPYHVPALLLEKQFPTVVTSEAE
jgi:ATP-dependent RNA helicase RhlE